MNFCICHCLQHVLIFIIWFCAFVRVLLFAIHFEEKLSELSAIWEGCNTLMPSPSAMICLQCVDRLLFATSSYTWFRLRFCAHGSDCIIPEIKRGALSIFLPFFGFFFIVLFFFFVGGARKLTFVFHVVVVSRLTWWSFQQLPGKWAFSQDMLQP